MACLPYNYDDGKVVLLPAKASITFRKGDMLSDDGAGYITLATAQGGTDINYIAARSITSASTDGATMLECWPTRGVKFVCDTDANPAQTDVGTLADIDDSDVGQIDPDASTDDIFYIEAIHGPVADKKVLGYFQHANET